MSAKENLDIKPACGAGIDLQARVGKLEDENSKQWEVLDKLRNRPPVWATILLTVMGTITGSALTYAAVCTKLAPAAAFFIRRLLWQC